MKMKLIVLPILAASVLMSGCASSPVANYLPFPLSLVAGGSVRAGSGGSDNSWQFDNTAAQNQLEQQIQDDGWQNEQMVQQETAAAIQASDDATAAASASAAASAAAGIGQ